MRKVIVILLILCTLYFAVGLILVWTGVLDKQSYLSIAGIVGGLASVFGLLSLARPVLTQTDIQNIEAESLQKLGDVSAEIKRLEESRSEAAIEINSLEARKKEMELLVRKASLSLFLKEQYEHHKKGVLDRVANDPKIKDGIAEIVAIEKKLAALDEEINRDENVEILREIIQESKTTSSPFDRAIKNSDPLTRFLLMAWSALRYVK